MRKVLFALAVVSLLAFGLRPEGHAELRDYTGCIDKMFQRFPAPGKAYASVAVGIHWFRVTPGGMALAVAPIRAEWYIGTAELAALEPFLATFRAGAAARVKAKVWYDDSTKQVRDVMFLFGDRCPPP